MSSGTPSSFVTLASRYDRMLAPLESTTLDAACLAPGERVIDVGCGAGGTSLAVATRVGPSGRVLGIDIDPDAIAVATARAEAAGASQVELVVADAQVHPLAQWKPDAVVSRMGTLHFREPVAAYRNLARALGPSGRLSLCAAGSPERNLWHTLPHRVVAEHLGRPATIEATRGPFALADRGRLESLLEAAGLVEVELRGHEGALWVGDDLDDAWAFFALTEGRELLARLDEPARSRLRDALQGALAGYEGRNGVRLPAAWWVATARPARPSSAG